MPHYEACCRSGIDRIPEVGIPRMSVNVKLFLVMSALFSLDVWGIQVFFGRATEECAGARSL